MIIEEERNSRSLEMLTENMTGEQIAQELGITKQAISKYLRQAMGKVYTETRNLEMGKNKYSPFEAAVVMSLIFNVGDEDITNFFKLFPKDIKAEIEDDAKTKMPELKKIKGKLKKK